MRKYLFVAFIIFSIDCSNETPMNNACTLQVAITSTNENALLYFRDIPETFHHLRDSLLKYEKLLNEQPQMLFNENAIQLFEEIIEYDAPKNIPKIRLLKAKGLRLHSTLHFYNLDYDLAIADLNKGLQFITPSTCRMDSIELADIYNYIGLAFESQINYPQAIEYFKKSYDTNIALGRNRALVMDLANIGVAYKSGNRLDSAVHYIERGVCIIENTNLNLSLEDSLAAFNNLTSLCVELAEEAKFQGEVERANQYYEQGILNGRKVLQKIIEMPDYFGIVPHFVSAHNLGNIFLQYNQLDRATPDSAIHYFNMAKIPLEMYEEETNTSMTDYQAIITFRIAAALAQKGDCVAANEFFQKADIFQISPRYSIYKNYEKGKSISFCDGAYTNSMARLKAQLNQYEIAINNLEGLLNTPGLESVVSSFKKKFKNIYSKPIEVAFQLYKEKPSKKNVNELLQLLDRSKSFNLKQRIYQKIDKLSFKERERSLFDREMDLRNRLITNPDDLNAQIELKHFISTLETSKKVEDFQYYLKRFNKPEYNLTDIRQNILKDSSAIIQYYFHPSKVYAVVITPEEEKVFILPDAKKIKVLGQKFHNSLHPYPPKNSLYRESAFPLYQEIFEPIQRWLNEMPINHLIIIPDGILQKVPFEGLITTDHKGAPYGILNYLMRDYDISYHFSIGSMLALEKLNNLFPRETKFGFLGLNATNINDQDIPAFTKNSANLPLPELVEKSTLLAEQISNEGIKTKFLPNATANNFIELANQAAIIQLTMHAYLSIENPNQSYLQFDNLSNEKITIKDIYPLNLNNVQLAVLSNCNTLDGAFSDGEGLTSLVRAFMYAGCSSVIGAVNAIEDKATAEILAQFYKELMHGETKYKALNIAKKKYLKINPNAHPQLWLNLIYLGDTQTINWKVN